MMQLQKLPLHESHLFDMLLCLCIETNKCYQKLGKTRAITLHMGRLAGVG